MRKKKRTFPKAIERPPRPPADCLSRGDDLRAGDESNEPFEALEYKAMATKGIPLAGKITMPMPLRRHRRWNSAERRMSGKCWE
jgi:hypothetical protein